MKELKTSDNWILITDTSLDVRQAWSFVQHPGCGATNLFTGTTRDHHDGRDVTALFYDCYEPMALKDLKKLISSIMMKYNLTKVAVFHKTGDAPVGEISLVTAMSAPHRQPVLHATDELIKRLKQNIPIWKRETFRDEEIWREEQMIRKRKRT